MKQPTMLDLYLSLQRRMREAETPAERGFIAVNETRIAFSYHQAALFLPGSAVPAAVSGVATPEADAPYMQWLRRLYGALKADQAMQIVKPGALPEKLHEGLSSWLQPETVWMPFSTGGGMLFSRASPAWSEAELGVLQGLVESYGLTLAPPGRARRKTGFRAGRASLLTGLLAVAILALVFVQTPLSVLAPAEVVAAHSKSVRAPMEGVIAEVYVETNQAVTPGTPLFSLDPKVLETEITVTASDLARSIAEYEQESQRALTAPDARLKLASLAAAITEQRARLGYLETRRDDITVRAQDGGRVVMSDKAEWIGRPVSTGEAVMAVAEPEITEIEAWMSAADAIPLVPGARVRLFLNAAPLDPLEARLDYMAYQAIQRPDGTVAHRLRAVFEEGEAMPRLGLQGTIRVDGPDVSLGYWILRRPLAMARRLIGF